MIDLLNYSEFDVEGMTTATKRIGASIGSITLQNFLETRITVHVVYMENNVDLVTKGTSRE